MNLIENRFNELLRVISQFQEISQFQIETSAKLISTCFNTGSKILICGNGGSAADAQHLAAEFVNAFSRDISRRGLPAIALTTDTSVITSISNDFNFDNIFARQVEALGKHGDVLIAFTTSGNSQNCLNAVSAANELGIKVVAFTKKGAEISKEVDCAIEVPSENTQHIQECHILAYHIIAELVENELFKWETL